MRHSARHLGIEPESIKTNQALPPSLPVKGKAAKGGRSAQDSIRTIQGEYEEPVLAGPITTGSDKGNEQKDSGKVSSVAQVTQIESSSRPKRRARGRRHLKAKSDPEPPVQPDIQNTEGEAIQLEQGATIKKREKVPLHRPEDNSNPLNDLHDLTEESYEVGIPVPESAPENWDFIESERQSPQSNSQNAEVEDANGVDPQEAFNLKWGCLPPLSEEATRIIDFIIANPDMAMSQSRKTAGTTPFEDGLEDRNVNFMPSDTLDHCQSSIQLLNIQTFMNEPADEERGHNALWELDQAKTNTTSSEALFQRTIMVSLIARHFLIYQQESLKEQMFEFSVEEPWIYFPPPSRALNEIDETSAPKQNPVPPQYRFLTSPKPDVAIAFNRRAIMSDETWRTLTRPMRQLASFEKVQPKKLNVFHFLAIEAKNSEKSVEDEKALHQCLNCASQALFNFYEFFRDADLKKEFFEEVRFFSIVTNRTGFLVRIHKAAEVPKDNKRLRVMPHDAEYLLGFDFQEFARLDGINSFSRSKALDIMKKLLKYAKETMCPLIRRAASAIRTKLVDPKSDLFALRSHPNTYRHGQPGIETGKNCRRSSVARSSVASLAQGMQKGNLESHRAPSLADEAMEHAQPTPKRSHKPRNSSNLKRPPEGFNEIGAPSSKRQRAQDVNG